MSLQSGSSLRNRTDSNPMSKVDVNKASSSVLEAPNDTALVGPLVKRLNDTFKSGVTKPLAWRIAALTALRKCLVDTEKEINEALYLDLHKCAFETWLAESNFCIMEIDEALHNVASWMKPRSVNTNLLNLPASSFIQKDPLGTVLIISPFNYPFQLLIAPLIGALAAGNTVVLKPSEQAPHISAWTKKYLLPRMENYGVGVIEGGVEPNTALLKHEFSLIFYTGGGHVAKIILRAAAEFLTPCILELGGKSPCLVLGDANLEIAAKRIVWGKLMNAGQTCVAPDYLMVEDAVHDKFVALLAKEVKAMYGETINENKDYGRIITTNHTKRLAGLVQPLEDGLKAVVGDPDQIDVNSKFIPPIFLTGATPNHRIMQDEIFGPILPILRVKSSGTHAITEMTEFINSRPKPLALYVFTSSDHNTETVLASTSSGGVTVNDTLMHLVNPALPFGGVGPSGAGSYHGEKSFTVFSHEKSVLKRSGATAFDAPQRYPPYTDSKAGFMKTMLKVQGLGLYKKWIYSIMVFIMLGVAAILITRFGKPKW